MIYLNTIILSIVQALTEFLPVSSSGHLIIVHRILDSGILNTASFDVFLHAGSLLAVIIYFWPEIIKISKNLVVDLKTKNFKHNFLLFIVVAILPAVLVGYFLEDFIEELRSPLIVASALIFGSIIFILAERFFKINKDLKNLNFKDSIIIGLMQCLAFIPGMSRSGITIVGGMQRGLSRIEAAKFSFLMAIPLLFGAGLKKIIDISFLDINHFKIYILGFLISFVFSILAIKILMKLLQNRYGLYSFAVYRLIIAIIILIFLS